MVLSGTLREFILADVFQLLAQQKITGKLHLNTATEDGFVLFKNGAIVCAFKDTERFETKLESFLLTVRRVNAIQVKAIFSAFKEDLHGLTNEIIAHSLMSVEEISTLSLSIIEDITCSLFLWKSGSYRFNSMRNVDKFIPDNCTIPIENIVMEAMRRIDEWNRMQEQIKDETIFVHTGNAPQINNIPNLNPISNPVEYLSTKINGISPVTEFISTTPLTQYKVCESLYSLIQSKQIAPLSGKFSPLVHAALNKKENEHDLSSLSTFFYAMIVTGFVLIIVLLSSLFFKGVLLSHITINADLARIELPRSIAEENKKIAQLYFRAIGRNGAGSNDDSLIQFKLISKKDLTLLKSK